MKVSRNLSIMVLSFTLVVLAGCSQAKTNIAQGTSSSPQATANSTPVVSSSPQATPGSKQVDEIEITVTHWPANINGLPYMIGMDKGFFEENQIKIKGVIPGDGGGTTVRNILNGKLPFGDVSPSAAIQAYLSGAPIMMVAGSNQDTSDFYYVTRKDSPLNKLEDFAGHNWAISSPGSPADVLTNLMAEKQGMNPKSIKLVPAGGATEQLTLLEKGGVDAAGMTEPNYSVQKDKYKTILNTADFVPKFMETVIVTNPQIISGRPDLAKRFLAAVNKSNDWLYKNPEEAGKIFAKYSKLPEPASINAISGLIKYKHWGLELNVSGLNTVIKGMKFNGTLKKGAAINWDEVMTQEFLPESVKKEDLGQLDKNQ